MDFYRAAAMAVVAVGHWLGMVVVSQDGKLDGGNLLDFSPEHAWITWIGQVMPLFFFVGGFGVVALGAAAAAIPLWFLPNDTIDTALAPFTFRWFRARPWALVGSLAVVFALAEAARFAGIPMVPQINWIIGWLGFQVAGFAWQDGRLPTGRNLAYLAAGCWLLTIAAVGLGPWPATMLHHGGLDHSPTHPPSFALLLFGFAYSFTAAALAPAITRWLERHPSGARRRAARDPPPVAVRAGRQPQRTLSATPVSSSR